MDTETHVPEHSAAEENDFLQAEITVEDRSFGSIYPIVQWMNGDPKAKKDAGMARTGGFFISDEQQLEIPGAEPFVLMTSDGEEIHGTAIRDLTISIVRTRRSYTVERKEGFPLRFAGNEYDDAKELGSPRSTLHVLAYVKGMEEPVVLTFRGYSAINVTSQSKKVTGIIPAFGRLILNAARRAAQKDHRSTTYPLCSFWLTVGPARNERGEPVFTEVGKGEQTSKVTLPIWLDVPAQVTISELNGRFVGHDLLGRNQQLFTAAQEWVDEWGSVRLAEIRSKVVRAKKPAAAPEGDEEVDGADHGASGGVGAQEVPF